MNKNESLRISWFTLDNLQPIGLFWYPSSTDLRIFEMDIDDKSDSAYHNGPIQFVFEEMRRKIKDAGFDQNKMVLKCKVKGFDTYVYLGWYDSMITLGLSGKNRDGAEIHPIVFKDSDINDWVFERSSGFAGYRNTKTQQWIYDNEYKQMFPEL